MGQTELTVGGLEFDAAHIVSWHPKCGRLHGHTYQVEVTLTGRLNEKGMVYEFGEFKKAAKSFLDEHLDHRFLVYSGFVHHCDEAMVSVMWGGNELFLQNEEVVPLATEATVEHIAELVARGVAVHLKVYEHDNVDSVKVLVTEGVRKHAVFVLGLKPNVVCKPRGYVDTEYRRGGS